jgi:hypothetical protein
VRTKYAS